MGFHTIVSTNERKNASWSTHKRMVRGPDGTLWCAYSKGLPAAAESRKIVCVAYSADGGETWTEEEVFSNSYLSYAVSLVVKSDGIPHLVFHNDHQPYSGDYIYYTHRTGGTWAAVVRLANYAGSPNLAVDGDDNLHLVFASAYYESGQLYNFIKYRKCIDGVWAVAEDVVKVWGSNYGQTRPRVAIQSDNSPVVAWEGRTGGTYYRQYRIRYSYKVEGSWLETPEIVQDYYTGDDIYWEGFSGLDLVVDLDDKPRVIYGNTENYPSGAARRIFYTWRDSAEADWANNLETVKGTDGDGTPDYRGASLTIHNTGFAHVVLGVGADIFHTFRETAEADWASNLENITSEIGETETFPEVMGATFPQVVGAPSCRFQTGIAFIFFYDVDTNNRRIVYYDGNPTYLKAKATFLFQY